MSGASAAPGSEALVSCGDVRVCVLLTVDSELHLSPDLGRGVCTLRATLVDSAVFTRH